MIISTVVLFAILVGDAIDCTPQQKRSFFMDVMNTCQGILVQRCDLRGGGCTQDCIRRSFYECDCKDSSKWTNGSYSIDKVDYDIDHYDIKSVETIVLTEKSIPNCSGHVQTSVFTVNESITRTSSFSFTAGVSIEVGTRFSAGFPELFEFGGSVSVKGHIELTYGHDLATTKMFSESYTCNGRPNKATVCQAVMMKGVLNIPYRMTLNHKTIPNCTCESKGIWTGLQAYNSTLIVKETDGKCTKPTARTIPLYQSRPELSVQPNKTSSIVHAPHILLYIILLLTLCMIF